MFYQRILRRFQNPTNKISWDVNNSIQSNLLVSSKSCTPKCLIKSGSLDSNYSNFTLTPNEGHVKIIFHERYPL